MTEERMGAMSVQDWLFSRYAVDRPWIRQTLLQEANLALTVLARSVGGLGTPSEDDAVHLRNGRKAAHNLDSILSAIEALNAGVPPDQILLPLWGKEEVLEAPSAAKEVTAEVEEPVEERPWEELGITEKMWNRSFREVLEDGEELYKATKSRVALVVNNMARALGVPSNVVQAGPALKELNKVSWEPGAIKGIGKTLVRFIWRKFNETDYHPPLIP